MLLKQFFLFLFFPFFPFFSLFCFFAFFDFFRLFSTFFRNFALVRFKKQNATEKESLFIYSRLFCVKRNIILTKGERGKERETKRKRETRGSAELSPPLFCILNFGRNPPTSRAFVLSLLLLLLLSERKMLIEKMRRE